ncbi:fumarylacetoacetate hydrolase family protein [Flexithrix dorotheae]|uniref:fumarylacetoacetate hydrolase family protein n=1 Tax=Flexithrix dorotheae TaxID=70993 RepID=UPI000371B2CB|nr:fumarylacetoacetate hydrolase family protein [Flexithrix dorotheae]
MKLIRYGEPGNEHPGIEIEGVRYDTSNIVWDYDEDFFSKNGIEDLKNKFDINTAARIANDVRLGEPVKRPGKIICIGLNYRKHAAESGMEVPKEPVVFFKATSSLIGPYDNIIIPKNSQKTDWEVELAVVIGKRANYISEEEAMDHVAGYILHNDVSEREFQIEKGGQWVKGKSCDTFAPMGPYLVTKEEVADPNNLRLWLTLNGKKMQDGNTSDFIFNIQYVIAYLSQYMSLMPGDIISTGTPEGVGFGFNPPFYLKDGDIIELGIEGLGESRQKVKAYS